MATGFNSDVQAGTVVFHVQTELRAADPALVETLVYREGRIVGARRLPVAHLLGLAPQPDALTRLTEEQHSAVVHEVREGRFAPDATPRSYTVAVIDDEPFVIDLVQRILARAGHRTVAVSDARRALDTVREARPDLVLCDVVMPDLDGYDVLHQLQSDPATARIPVAFATGMASEQDRIKAFRFGAVEYFAKPFPADALVARIETLIAERSHRPRAVVRAPAWTLVRDLQREARSGVVRFRGPKGPAAALMRAGEVADGVLPGRDDDVGDAEFTELDLDFEDVVPQPAPHPDAPPLALPSFDAIPPALRVVLLVEDDRVFRRRLRYVLVERGCTVLEADDGEEGLLLAREERPWVVVTDTRMPRMDGFELCRALRESWHTAHLPLLFLSGWADSGEIYKGLAVGADDHLCKSATLQVVLLHILLALKRYADVWPPAEGGVSGRLEAVGVVPLLRLCELAARSGFLTLGHGEQCIEVRYRVGAIVGADSSEASGLPALLELAAWHSGAFAFAAGEPDDPQPVAQLDELLAAMHPPPL